MKPEFKLKHIGINPDRMEAEKIVTLFGGAFGLETKEGAASYFAGAEIEVMKEQGRGAHGHLAFETEDVDYAVSYLKEQGFTIDEATIKYHESGAMRMVYLNEQIGGFAVHLMLKK